MSTLAKQKRGLANASAETRMRVARSGGRGLAKKHRGDMFYHDIGSLGGQTTAREMRNTGFYQKIGQRGGMARQRKTLR